MWKGIKGHFPKYVQAFTTQVNITCSMPSHNTTPSAPQARQQATVSQEAQSGSALSTVEKHTLGKV